MKDEPIFADFYQDKNILDSWLVKINFKNNRSFLTYKKLESIEKICTRVF